MASDSGSHTSSPTATPSSGESIGNTSNSIETSLNSKPQGTFSASSTSSFFHRFTQQKERIRIVFEQHKTLLSLSATILSCLAAWVGYQSRIRHQEKLEKQLQTIQMEITGKSSHASATSITDTWNEKKYVMYVMTSGAVLGYLIGRYHGKQSAIKKMLAKEAAKATGSNSSASNGGTFSFKTLTSNLEEGSNSSTAASSTKEKI